MQEMKAMTEAQALTTGMLKEQALEMCEAHDDMTYNEDKDRFEVKDGDTLVMSFPAKYVKLQTGDGIDTPFKVHRELVYDFTELNEALKN